MGPVTTESFGRDVCVCVKNDKCLSTTGEFDRTPVQGDGIKGKVGIASPIAIAFAFHADGPAERGTSKQGMYCMYVRLVCGSRIGG
jgi:hypothetical protein